MKRYLQSYHAFLPGRYMRWIIYLVYPLAMLLLLTVGGLWIERSILMAILPFVMVSVECTIDMFVFGGFGAKGVAKKIEYVKCSVKGRGMVNRALIFDWGRRVFYQVVMLGVFYAAFYIEHEHRPAAVLVWGMLCLMVVAGFINSIALWVIRFIDNRPAQLGALYLMVFLPGVFISLVGERNVGYREVFAVCMTGYLLSMAGQVAMLMKKMKEGYHDK